MLPDCKTNRAFCFGDHALRGIGGLFMGCSFQNLTDQDLAGQDLAGQDLAGQNIAGKTEPFVNFGPAQFLRYQPLERA